MSTRPEMYIEGIGAVEVEMLFKPADPAVGIMKPYVDEMYLYYPHSDIMLSDEDFDSITDKEIDGLEQEYTAWLSEQAGLARVYRQDKRREQQ